MILILKTDATVDASYETVPNIDGAEYVKSCLLVLSHELYVLPSGATKLEVIPVPLSHVLAKGALSINHALVTVDPPNFNAFFHSDSVFKAADGVGLSGSQVVPTGSE